MVINTRNLLDVVLFASSFCKLEKKNSKFKKYIIDNIFKWVGTIMQESKQKIF
jgi:hypothetical protein